MKLTGTRFGILDYSEEDIVTLPDGLIGFEHLTRYVVLNARENSPFRWLQSLEDAAVAFLVTDPFHYVQDYTPKVPTQAVIELEIEESTPWLVWTTANIPAGQPKQMTLNLAGPIVVNAETRLGRQVVIENEAYTTRYRVFAQDRDADVAAA